MIRVLAVLALLSLSAGCATYHQSAPERLTGGGALAQTRYHGEIVAPDGVKIRFTVWQPALKRGEKAPLILHAHGFALTRMNSKMDIYAKLLTPGKAALRAWEQGYWVISFDQRGHGASGGKIGLHDADKEVADVSRLIDWAVANLPIAEENGDPKVGMLGESYGGALQLMASAADPRIDALIPVATWYDLEQGLLPDGVPKSEWILVLGAAGYGFNPFHMDGSITGGMFKEIIFDDARPDLRRRLHRNSPAARCDAGEYPHADVLLMQGMRDVLFPLNQALANRECLLKAGRDVRLVTFEHGHLSPTAQLSPRLPVWHMQENVLCDGRTVNIERMMVQWFDLKLRGRNIPDTAIPRWCLTGDRNIDAAQAQPPSLEVALGEVHVGSGASGLVEWAARPLDHVGNWFRPNRLPADWATPSNGWMRPARIPLLKIDGPTWVAGVARAEIDVYDTDRANPILFLRLAAWKPGSGSYRVLNQQVTPVRGRGRHTVDLAAVRARLERGEVVGLLVQGYSNQFRLTGSGWGTDASIRGTLTLPVAGAR